MGGDPIDVECDWGLNGLRAHARGRIVVIVDVLSFSTATTVAVSRGAEIFPCVWNDDRAAELARLHQAEVAAKRGKGRFSLAPSSLRAIPAGTRLVLPSPNGSTLSHEAMALGAAGIVIGCIRNAAAVAKWINGKSAVVIAAGERWPDNSIRFAIEDWIGAGAILSRIKGKLSAPAEAAAAAFGKLPIRDTLAESPSGI
ncbi:MAG TPA: 2-phosphosulfolactate phosphatase, partial [Thermoanaerobaculia bacterium]|nr:2-phosphosulfolactate phosphatase [Thermoanaerobaculia bacterium]